MFQVGAARRGCVACKPPAPPREICAIVPRRAGRIALFGYADLPSELPHQRLVERAGHLHLGLDHFARPGSRLARAAAERRMARTFQGHVEHRADSILGVGVSAISSTPRMHWQSHGELPAWERGVAAGHEPRAVRCGSCHPFSSGPHASGAPLGRFPIAPPGPGHDAGEVPSVPRAARDE
jgi:hypothetical protein